jgi:hypothetical protein
MREFRDYKTSYLPTSAKNIDSDILACYQFYLTERSLTEPWSILRQAQDRWGKGHRAIQQNFSCSMLYAIMRQN